MLLYGAIGTLLLIEAHVRGTVGLDDTLEGRKNSVAHHDPGTIFELWDRIMGQEL